MHNKFIDACFRILNLPPMRPNWATSVTWPMALHQGMLWKLGVTAQTHRYEFEVLIFKFLIITVVIQGVDPRGLALLLPWAAKHPQENRHWQDLALIKTLRIDKTNCDSLGRMQGRQQSGVRPGGGEALSGEAVQGVLQSWLICWLRCCPNSVCFNIFSIHHQANLFSPNLPFFNFYSYLLLL